MKSKNAKVLWNAEGEVVVLPVAESRGARPDLRQSGGAVRGGWKGDAADLFALFLELTVRDRVPLAQAHRAFCQMDEYRALLRGLPVVEGWEA
jgi:hypothetical protein